MENARNLIIDHTWKINVEIISFLPQVNVKQNIKSLAHSNEVIVDAFLNVLISRKGCIEEKDIEEVLTQVKESLLTNAVLNKWSKSQLEFLEIAGAKIEEIVEPTIPIIAELCDQWEYLRAFGAAGYSVFGMGDDPKVSGIIFRKILPAIQYLFHGSYTKVLEDKCWRAAGILTK